MCSSNLSLPTCGKKWKFFGFACRSNQNSHSNLKFSMMNHSFQYLVCIELYWYKDQGKNILLRSQSNSINNMTFIELLMRSIHSKICLVIFGYHVQLSNNYTFFIDRIPMLKTWSEIQWNSNCLVRIYTWVRFYYLYLANSFIKIIWIIHLSFIYDYSLQNKKQKNNVQGNEARL